MSVENRLFRAYGKGCGRGLLIYALAAVVVLCGVCSISAMVMVIPAGESRGILWAVLVSVFVLLVVGITAIGAVIVIRRRAATLDAVFAPLGLAGKSYMYNGRQYHGTYRGYPLHIYFYRGPTLAIYVDVPLGVRMGVGRGGALSSAAAQLTDKDALEVDDPRFEHLEVYPSHPEWATEFLANPETRETILRLTSEETASEVRVFSITPEALLWQTRYLPMRFITAERVRAWLDDLSQLARLARDVPPPDHPLQESGMEQTARAERGKFVWPAVGITCGVLALMGVCMLLVSGVLIYLSEGGM